MRAFIVSPPCPSFEINDDSDIKHYGGNELDAEHYIVVAPDEKSAIEYLLSLKDESSHPSSRVKYENFRATEILLDRTHISAIIAYCC